MKTASVLFFGLCLVAAKAATTLDSDFLDRSAKPIKPTSKEVTTEKLHKIDLDRNEVVEDGKMKQFNVTINPNQDEGITTTQTPVTKAPTTQAPTTKAVPTTAAPEVTTKSPSTLKPTTSTVPLDDHTTAKAKVTTQKTKVTTESAKATTPAPDASESHLLKWIVAGIFCGVIVVMLSMYAYKFYIHRTESSYQNL